LDKKGAAGMELTMQERKKLTMVKAQAYLKAGQRSLLGGCILVAALESCLRRYPSRVRTTRTERHVEEKNNSVIRKFVGYDRHDSQAEIDLVNWFLPSQKLLHKERMEVASPRCTTLHRPPVHGCWHGWMFQKRRRNRMSFEASKTRKTLMPNSADLLMNLSKISSG
jgi:1,6-anhydro-N-acetylmuramate kinase